MPADEPSKNDDCSLAYIDALVSLGQRVGKTLFSDLGDAGLFTFHHRLYSEMDLEFGYQRKSFIDLFLKCGGQFLKEAQRFRLVTEAHSIYATPEAPGSLMNNLAGNWLALYFMGIPFVHLWEPVMFFSEGSGFPRGASLCKVVGDIYRDSRIAYVRDPSKGSRVLVLDHNPLAFPSLERSLQTLLKNGQHTSETLLETANAYLGALYELLQMRLYLHAGAPIKFMVPQASLLQAFKSRVEKLPEKERLEKHEEDIAYLWRWLCQVDGCRLPVWLKRSCLY
ncbi:hypothetical protein PQR75_45300 [Paraburkholderia fungorum]|uniref:hypothetical protein n=1 Tax=Paraburkholderia fungorum TaxID=134537 RepID=UPI0038BD4D51